MSGQMAFQIQQDRVIIENEDFLSKAKRLKPKLIETRVFPNAIIEVYPDENKIHGWNKRKVAEPDALKDQVFGKDDEIILDFGEHLVGYFAMNVYPVGSPPDAPLKLKVTFGEMPVEVAEDFSTYNGAISHTWLQQEEVYMDVLPGVLKFKRRYSFRYVKLEVLGTSLKYKVSFDHVVCTHVSSADRTVVEPLKVEDEILAEIDRVSIKTLADCMQDVFEDGPKRDRRLWLGDLRLQALANYETVKNYDLVKRCLYLFAGTLDEKGRISSNLFMKPKVIPDDTYLTDYSLFFMDTLIDYYAATEDTETLHELWPIAWKQIELALEQVNEHGLLKGEGEIWAFIDWAEGIERATAAHAILIYVIKKAVQVAELVSKQQYQLLLERIAQLEAASLVHLWDDEKQFFISGEEKQVSYASQVWMILAGVVSEEKARDLLKRLPLTEGVIEPSTPYMYHHLIEAYFVVGEQELAVEKLKGYWGGMLEDGADTFWELYNPNDKTYSPYGGYLINSYCHAWSCTPTYFIRKYRINSLYEFQK